MSLVLILKKWHYLFTFLILVSSASVAFAVTSSDTTVAPTSSTVTPSASTVTPVTRVQTSTITPTSSPVTPSTSTVTPSTATSTLTSSTVTPAVNTLVGTATNVDAALFTTSTVIPVVNILVGVSDVTDSEPPEAIILVEVVPEFRGEGGDDDAVFRFLGVQVTDNADPNPTAGDVTLNGVVIQPGDLLRLKLDDEFEVEQEEEEEDEFALRMEAPEFIFSVTVSDAAGNVATIQAAILVDDFAGADLDVDEVELGTENQRGTPIDEDAQEEFDDNVEDLLDDGFVNPPGIPSAIVT